MKIRQIFKKAKSLDYRHYINFVITLGFLALGIFIFSHSFHRVLESFRDLWNSMKFYFFELFSGLGESAVTVNDLPGCEHPLRFEIIKLLPFTWEEFQAIWSNYWSVFISKDVFFEYCIKVSDVLFILSKVLLIALPFFLIFSLLF